MGNRTLNDAMSTIPADKAGQFISGVGQDDVLSRIEATMDGDAVEKPVKTDEVIEEEVVETETVDETEESTETEEEVDETETEETETEETAETETSEDAIELTEDQLAYSLGLDEGQVQVDDEGNTLVKVKIDGEESFVSLAEMRKNYQIEEMANKKMRDHADTRKEFETFRTAETEKLQGVVTNATALVMEMEANLTAAAKNIDMEALRQQNPGEYAALQQDIHGRQAHIEGVKQRLGQIIQAQSDEQKQLQDEQRNVYVLEQTERLIEKIPKWADSEVAGKELDSLQSAAMESYGFTSEEIGNVLDHRLILVLLDAVKGRSVSDPEPIRKKLKKVPKVIKSSGRQPARKSQSDKQTAAKRNRLKETGSIKDTAAILLDRM